MRTNTSFEKTSSLFTQMHRIYCSLFAVLFLLTCMPCAVADAAQLAKPRCAFIEITPSPLGGKIESNLSVRDEVEWLERNEINKVPPAKKKQTLVTAKAYKDRVAIGKTLQADILVLLRSETRNDKKYAQLVIAETKRGLRIASEEIELSQNLEQDALSLASLFDEAIEKSREPIEHIFAVPPFVSHNLTNEFNYLNSTYAHLIEQSLSSLPGVFVVELEEARALAQERAISNNAGIQRALPVFVLGEYQLGKQDGSLQVMIHLKIEQAGKSLQTLTQKVLPNQAASFLRTSATDFAESQGAAQKVISPVEESSQIATRAETLLSLANWEEALGLFEAALLLQPENPDLHGRAIYTIQKVISTYNSYELEGQKKVREMNRRWLDHLKVLAEIAPKEQITPYMNILRAPRYHYLEGYNSGGSLPEALMAEENAFQKERQDLALKLSQRLGQENIFITSGAFFSMSIAHLPPVQQYAEKVKVLLKYQGLKEAKSLLKYYCYSGYSSMKQSIESERFLRDLIEHPEINEPIKQEAQRILESFNITIQKKEYRTQGDPNNETLLTFKPVDIVCNDLYGQKKRLTSFDGIIPLERGIDLIYERSVGIILVSQNGVQQVWTPGKVLVLDSVKYDGRYVWVVTEGKVIVIDLKSNQQILLTEADGLPAVSPKFTGKTLYNPCISLAPLGIGHAIVSGYDGVAWIANVKISPRGKPSVKIIHQAREVFTKEKVKIDWEKTDYVFAPKLMRAFSRKLDDGNIETLVSIPRGAREHDLSNHCLLVDPTDYSISVSQAKWSDRRSMFEPDQIINGSHFYAGAAPPKHDSIGLLRVGLPNLEPEVVIPNTLEGYVVINDRDNIVNIVGLEWQRGQLTDNKLRSFGPVPWLYSNHWGASPKSVPIRSERGSIQLRLLADSNLFGSVATCQIVDGKTGIVQVLFDGSGTSLVHAITGSEQAIAEEKPSLKIKPSAPVAMNLWKDRIRFSSMAHSPDGSYLITTKEADEQSVQAWDVVSGDLLANLADANKGFTQVVFSPSGRWFATGSPSGQVIVWDAFQQQPVKELEGLKEEITAIAFSWDDEKIIAASQDRTASVWTVVDGKHLFDVEARNQRISWVGFNSDNSKIITTSQSHSTKAWDASTGKFIGLIESLGYIAGYLQDRSLIGSSSQANNTLFQWISPNNEFIELWPLITGQPVGVSPNGNYLVTNLREAIDNNERKTIHRIDIWDLNTKQKIVSEDGIGCLGYHFNIDLNALDILTLNGNIKRVILTANPMSNTTTDPIAKPSPNPKPVVPDQPKASVMRTWTDITGQHKIIAAMIGYKRNVVLLRTAEGQQMTIPLKQFSKMDQLFVRKNIKNLK